MTNPRHAHLSESPANGAPLHPTVLDVGTQRVAKVYAAAILRAAQTQNEGDQLLEEFESLANDVLPADPRLGAFLSSGIISKQAKAKVLRSVFSSRASALFVNSLLFLNDHGRLDLLRPITAACRDLPDRQAGRLRFPLLTTVPLPHA